MPKQCQFSGFLRSKGGKMGSRIREPKKNFRLRDIRTGELVSQGLIRAVSAKKAAENYAKLAHKDERLSVFYEAEEVDMLGVPVETACPDCGYKDVHPNLEDCPICH